MGLNDNVQEVSVFVYILKCYQWLFLGGEVILISEMLLSYIYILIFYSDQILFNFKKMFKKLGMYVKGTGRNVKIQVSLSYTNVIYTNNIQITFV